ncbi:MAG: SPFH domain-containing protein [Gammaproteobacteria bacterium]|nr:SPFH domain-containing protein [Gammaproteobacteria bacterium]
MKKSIGKVLLSRQLGRIGPGVVGLGLLAVFGFIILSGSFYIIETGHVGVERTLGKVDMLENQAGVHFKLPILTQQYEFSAKEITIDLEDLRPKAADNLSLKDLDVTIFYRTAPAAIAELMVKYNDSSVRGAESELPAYRVVFRESRGSIYEAVSEIDSLELHRKREFLQRSIMENLQIRLDEKDPDVFEISRVVVRALNTDPSIEASIREAVQNQKRLEAKRIEVDIAQKDAEIEIERARGIAQANEIINASLTAEYLQHEVNLALQSFADNGGSTVVIPANMQGFDLILDQSQLRRSQ